MGIDQEIAKHVCKECRGLPSALKLCFLCLVAFSEDKVILTEVATKHWIGEGMVTRPNPVRTREIFVNLLANRCLIEPLQKDHNEKLTNFRVQDLFHDLAHQIAEKEEKCFFQAHKSLGKFPADNYGGNVKISLMDNGLTRVPRAFKAPYIHTLLLPCNTFLTTIPKEVIGRITALRVLDFSRTTLHSLPKNMGSALRNLQVLYLCGSDITHLPSRISKLTSLKLLDVSSCEHLQCMPYGISQLTSLEYLDANNSPNIGWNKCIRDGLSINELETLNQLKSLLELRAEHVPRAAVEKTQGRRRRGRAACKACGKDKTATQKAAKEQVQERAKSQSQASARQEKAERCNTPQLKHQQRIGHEDRGVKQNRD
ncbi:hypothetical protein SUGI_0559780 [Cryptomeria japonica]|nr:hypothetical protein SUGI_0559780 [Cryptomeria japonica]